MISRHKQVVGKVISRHKHATTVEGETKYERREMSRSQREIGGFNVQSGIHPAQNSEKITLRADFRQETDTLFPRSVAERKISVGSVPHFVAVRPYV